MKLLISDYDNTFYKNNIDIQDNIIKANEFMKENIFIIATGRSYSNFMNEVKKYNISCNYIICNHGATIIKNNNILHNEIIDQKIIKNLIDDLKSTNPVTYFECSNLESKINLNSNKISKIYSKYETTEKALQVLNSITNKYKDYIKCISVSNNLAIEIISKKVSKSFAINKIQKILDISKKNIYTIGDNYNDIEMIKDYNGYSMEDSIDIIKKYSKKEYQTVKEFIDDIIIKKI